jgi:hypothetical protein
MKGIFDIDASLKLKIKLRGLNKLLVSQFPKQWKNKKKLKIIEKIKGFKARM